MNYAQKYDLFFPFFIKVVVNKSKAYSFLIIGMMHLQKILLSVIMLRFHFFTAKQGTWVHKDDRGPLCLYLSPWKWHVLICLYIINIICHYIMISIQYNLYLIYMYVCVSCLFWLGCVRDSSTLRNLCLTTTDYSVDVGVFVIWVSQISSFFSCHCLWTPQIIIQPVLRLHYKLQRK